MATDEKKKIEKLEDEIFDLKNKLEDAKKKNEIYRKHVEDLNDLLWDVGQRLYGDIRDTSYDKKLQEYSHGVDFGYDGYYEDHADSIEYLELREKILEAVLRWKFPKRD